MAPTSGMAEGEVVVTILRPLSKVSLGLESAPTASSLLSQLDSWEFNIYAFHRATGGKPLVPLTMAVLEKCGLLDNWLLNLSTVHRYLVAAEDGYRNNPYHSSLHAADVVQGAGCILKTLKTLLSSSTPSVYTPSKTAAIVAAPLSKLEKFAMVFAAAVHDLGHPGVNNDFLVKSQDKMAVLYGGMSVDEKMHASHAFELARGEGTQIFEGFSEAEFTEFQQLVVAMILATDMALHGAITAQWQAAIAACPDVRQWRGKERPLLLQMALHVADLSNPARPWPLAFPWGERIVTEMVAQGVEEAARGMAVSPPCDGRCVNLPKAQLGFVRLFAEPTLKAFAAAAPEFYSLIAPFLAETRARWEALLEAGVRAPRHGDYAFSEEVLAAAAEAGKRAEGEAAALLQQLEGARALYWQQRQEQEQEQQQQ